MKGSPPLMRAIEVLADGDWHDMAAVLIDVMKHVEPSKAIRRAETDRVHSLIKHGLDPKQERKRTRPLWQLQQIGARAMARELILKSPRFQVQWLDVEGTWHDDPRKAPRHARTRVRLRPNYVYNQRPPKIIPQSENVGSN